MAQTIKLRRSATEGKVPTTSQLALGEIAINTYDGRIFFEKNDGSATIEHIVTTNSTTTGSIELVSPTDGAPIFDLKTTHAGVNGPKIRFFKDGASPATDDSVGSLLFLSDDSAGNLTQYGTIRVNIANVTSTDEAGRMELVVASSDGTTPTSRPGIRIEGHPTSDYVNVDLGNGASSTTSISGSLNITTVANQASEATSLMINGSGVVGTRELGSNAFTSTTIGTTSNALTDGTGIADFSFDGSGTATISTDDSAIVHDNLSGFVANEHIDHSSVSITAGTGLNGGGTIASTRTLNVDDDYKNTSLNSLTGSLVTKTGSETLTNKTLTAPDINAGTADSLTSLTVANNIDIGDFQLRAKTLRSDVSTGTSPFTVASTTTVANLSADMVDGVEAHTLLNNSLNSFTASNANTSLNAATGSYITAVRTVTAGGNTLASGETLAFTEGSNVTITESGGAVTIASTDTNTQLSTSDVRSKFSAGEGIDISSGEISGEDASTSNKGIASFSSDNFSVSSGAVTIKDSGVSNDELAGSIANGKLANSAITISGTSVSLGGSITDETLFGGVGVVSGSDQVATTFAQTILDDADAAAVRTTIGVDAAGTINYTLPTNLAGDDIDVDTGALTGATVISDLDFNITTNTSGLVTDANGSVSTRTLTAANLSLGNVTNESKATMFTSPTFTGTTAAPTPSSNDNSTKIATTAYVQTELTDLVGNAPAAFDTLGEISASLAADSGALDSLTTVVAGKLAKTSNLSDLSNASTARSNLGVDAAGTDNSTNVTLAGTPNYITISGQEITRNTIDIGDDTNLAVSDTSEVNMILSGDTLSAELIGGVVSGSSQITNIANSQLAGSIANGKLANSAITIMGTSTSLGGSFSTDNVVSALANTAVSNESLNSATGSYITAVRSVTAGGNTLASGETLAFTAGSNVTITETGGAVTIASTDTNTQLSTSDVRGKFSAGEGIDISSGEISGEDASTSNKGIASFSSDNFSVSSGAVTIKDGGVANAELVNSSITISGTSVSLGSSITDQTLFGGTGVVSGSAQIDGSSISNKSVSFGGVSVNLGSSDSTPAFNLADATGYLTSNLSGTITNSQLAGSIAAGKLAGSIGNSKLSNSAITISGTSVSLGSSITDETLFGGTGVISGSTQLQSNFLRPAQNLDDVSSISDARDNLGLGSLATLSSIDISSNTNLAVSDTSEVNMILSGDTISAELIGGVVSGSSQVSIGSTTGTLAVNKGGTGATTAAGARTNLGVDAAGTDNSTNVSLSGTPDYITISGQVITRNQIDLANDVTGILPSANLDSDTAHLSGTQTFSGPKSFTGDAKFTGQSVFHILGDNNAIFLSSSNSYDPANDDGFLYIGGYQTGNSADAGIIFDYEDASITLKSELKTANNIEVTSTTQSTSKTSGAIKISGGVGIAKTLNVGEDVVAFASSDERYKDLITPIENPNEKIKLLSGNTFIWNDKHEVFKGKKDIGIIAQEVEKVFPEIVDTRDDGYKAVKYEKLVALLIESNKELIKRVEELESKIK